MKNSIFGSMKSGTVKGKLNIVKFLIVLAIVAAIEFVCFYAFLPAINFHDEAFWLGQAFFVAIIFFFTLDFGENGVVRYNIVSKVLLGAFAIGAVVFVIGAVSSATIFNAGKYASLIEVEERDFNTDLPSASNVSNIALMDTESAKIVGQRAIGSLSDVVSQYEISEQYSTICYNEEPVKVATLEYAGFFKWLNNRDSGIPGYVMVDPVKFEAKYVKLEKPMKYTSSGWFNDNLQRHLRFQYPSAIFEGYYFELDEDGKPYYVCPTLSPKVSMFGAYDVSGVVVCDPCSGDSKYYAVGEIPNWVDRVYDGELATKKYDWKGTLSGGFINSVIGQEGCKMTTNDYGYKVMDGDVWVYTGVTSVIGDQSNIGFILINARTCESIYYTIAGAEEFSAMEAAEGQVQNLGYEASFPSLINVDGEPTYLMVLKDKSGIVKLYAFVNMEKYSIVATATNQADGLKEYKKLLKDNGIQNENVVTDRERFKKTTVTSVSHMMIDGNSYIYIIDEEGDIFKRLFSEDENMLLVRPGNTIDVRYVKDENGICQITELKIVDNSTSNNYTIDDYYDMIN